ncbi:MULTISPECIES: DUF512 domain-containing protein [Anaerotruncus]|uniref:DUF512 domain-containing protein n=1 Tax=Anaerotruncus TaxID=244127 RepID=UPI00207FDA97|nr:DUF512 domain-containing protein [Anaerotruncus massiliensis (ex Togo et al. 2019)]GKH48266.1 radical SAM protein [Oscillospiraceae bacterium]
MPVLIQTVAPGSHAARAGVRPGDTLLTIGGRPINDVLDYRFYMTDRQLELSLLRGGAPYSVRIKKAEYDDIGLDFETYLMDKQHSCKNKCVFCFIDQMPPGMRESLYFKDDDSRLSFLFGNYITLTNLTDADIDRIIEMHISPVNVSVHTTDPALRVAMMKNPNAAGSLRYIERLAKAGIRINTQLVLCPGWNDGEALAKTLADLGKLYPGVQSVACVPVGLTKYREGLAELRSFTAAEAGDTIDRVEAFQQRMLEEHGERVAYPSDEFFLLAGRPIPAAGYYGEFAQLENGVGLLSLLEDEFSDAFSDDDGEGAAEGAFTVATGKAACPLISSLARRVMDRYPGIDIRVRAIENRFFGEKITVAGLVTGVDLAEQLGGEALGDRLLLPSAMLRHERDKFLDDMTLEALEEALGVPVLPVDNDGYELYAAMTGRAGVSVAKEE